MPLRPGRNPLVVQFWLWGLDAASGDLRNFAQAKHPCQRGSSIYQMGAWSVHSMGLALEKKPQLYYDRPAGLFYRCDQMPAFDGQVSGRPIHRTEGLLAVHGIILEYENWISSIHGPFYREKLLAGKLPAKVRREVQAWKHWMKNDLLDATPSALRMELSGAVLRVHH